ncbi:MAG: 16S rRNA (adenine(1518)-N(6)/adenine(1519)-N(6))-dimethyltransferase [Gammaproteobacteria bacterium HGW-Gammaproteobacteria-8]|nr:MAG: 16S rRNA (adenine(1518)-N(6)/adenine(1519)-N(6))-dimethyltransferase [Gammaproteobacteria bacterium HGW-Gammaproteobacteria-8]
MGHVARKRFGQNFLVDESVIDRIVASIAPRRDDRMVEIGPGLGALTRPLLARLERLDVVELDRDLAGSLPRRLGEPPGLVVHQADALTFDFESLDAGAGVRVIGNLPYNISTPLLFHLLDQSDAIVDMHFMLQKEVVDRLTASPGSKAWGRLGVMTAARATATLLFLVPPEAFQPAPKVESAIVRIVPKRLDPDQRALLPALEAVTRAAFAQRRKTLRNNFKGLVEAGQLDALGIDPGARAETLSLAEFKRLAEVIDAMSNTRID